MLGSGLLGVGLEKRKEAVRTSESMGDMKRRTNLESSASLVSEILTTGSGHD